MTESRKTTVRIAFRQEGVWWNAYLAHPDTMQDAKLVATILMGAVVANPQIKEAFMDLAKAMLAAAIQDVSGVELGPEDWNWRTERAPEAERSGHA